ncbi:sensor histidine kinase [Spongiimicrobium salis]|uniref:sensor histidine kinase n=1 Tax=Spongiimicrobium salis TaxID=1667022 RepID=UPI00374D1DAC
MQNPNLFSISHYHRPVVFNGLLWLFSFVILVFIFSKGAFPKEVDYIYTLSFLFFMVPPVLLILYVLIPKLLKKERYFLFVLVFIGNLLLAVQIHKSIFDYCLDRMFPNHFFISYSSYSQLIILFSIFLVAVTLIKLTEDWFYFNTKENKQLKKENLHIQTQLLSLRSQINPHFLFNSLNVIYSLALDKKEETQEAIVQLSDMLRYVIYDTNTPRVLLKDEITLLKNYIDFQKFRVQGFENIAMDITVKDDNYALYPMLLLPLIENSFKYGIKDNLKDAYIHITIKQAENDFEFCIKNNAYAHANTLNDGYSGVGLQNIKKNLDIIYPNAHRFEINETATTFEAYMQLTTSP